MSFIVITDEDAIQSGRHLHNLVQDKYEEGYIRFHTSHHEAVGCVVEMCLVEDLVARMADEIKQRDVYLFHKEQCDVDEPEENNIDGYLL